MSWISGFLQVQHYSYAVHVLTRMLPSCVSITFFGIYRTWCAGVDFISSNDSIHFSSVVAYHKESKSIHVDDTFMFIPFPDSARFFFFKQGTVQLHPTLAAALEPRKGASQDFRKWMNSVSEEWGDAENLCAAHTGNLLHQDNTGESIKSRLKWALLLVAPVLWLHDLRYGK